MNRFLTPSFLCNLLLLWLTAAGAAAEVRTILEPRLIDEMETVRLTLRVAGANQLEPPDFSPLETDFEVLGTQNSSRISSINGRTSAVIEYQVTLRPRRTGQLVVPALKLGDEYSEALEIAVRPMDPGVRAAIGEMIFFETELTDNPVYVQAQTVLIRRLYYSNGVQIYSDLPGLPDLPNAVVVPLGDTRQTTAVRDNRRYGVIEQRFAIFPEQSGTLIIPSISVTSSVRLQSGGRSRRSGIRVATEELTLNVLPIPASYPASEPWLPAEAVMLNAEWVPERERYDAGEPVELKITAQVVGNVSSALPPFFIDLPSAQFKVYPEAPDLIEDTSGERVIGQRERTFALIPTAPGRARIPAITLTWWDTRADQLRQTELAPRTLQITGAAPTAPPPMIPEPDAPPAAEAAADRSHAVSLLTPQVYGVLGFVLLLAVLVLLYRYLPLPATIRLPRRRNAARRQQMKALTASARSGDLARFKQDLVEYLSLVFDCQPVAALERFRRQSTTAAELLQQLDQALYSQEPVQFDCSNLLALAKHVNGRVSPPPRELPALYS